MVCLWEHDIRRGLQEDWARPLHNPFRSDEEGPTGAAELCDGTERHDRERGVRERSSAGVRQGHEAADQGREREGSHAGRGKKDERERGDGSKKDVARTTPRADVSLFNATISKTHFTHRNLHRTRISFTSTVA